MNSFVIMPFAEAFDDVYVTIKASVAAASNQCKCFRLDEARPAGRITDRLLQELRTASFCIADLTGNRPNVMWEVGYAMALGCPTIILTQKLADLAFDIRDMQCLEYDRSRLGATLGKPLERMIVDTLSAGRLTTGSANNDDELVGKLLSQIADLKNMVEHAVCLWQPPPSSATAGPTEHENLLGLQGAWVNMETNSHAYATVVHNDLVVPYCYQGDDELTGAYFGWRKTGGYWFARYAWVNGAHSGFTFLKHESVDLLRGAWWGDGQGSGFPEAPPDKAGVEATWVRRKDASVPDWAKDFCGVVERKGMPNYMRRVDGS